MNQLAKHFLLDLEGCDPVKLDDLDYLRGHLLEAARIGGATIINSFFHRFSPQGVSGVVLIAESHLSLHTWPEENYAAIDLFSCGLFEFQKACDYLVDILVARSYNVKEIKRGKMEGG